MRAPPLSLDDIKDAANLIEGAVRRTPFLSAPRLSQLTGADIHVKYENLQITNAFKERGALVKLLSLSQEERERGVVAMSAGNHAQAIAYHAARLNIPATIVMPVPTPYVKVQATRSHGAKVVLAGNMVTESAKVADDLAREKGLVWVHPFDDPDVIRGQGTIALEMLADVPDLDTLIVPIGGGGLISGMAIAAKAINPRIEVIGVETALYPSMWSTLRGEEPRVGGNTLAEGIAVKDVGELTQVYVREYVDDILLVKESEIERAVNAYLTLQKTMAEGAGATGLAALFAAPERFRGRKVGLVLCGGNIDPRIAAAIMVRELARTEQIIAIRITLADRPGLLGEISTLMGKLGGNILDVSHHRLFLNVLAKDTTVDITFEAKDAAHANEVIAALEARNFKVERLGTPGDDATK